MIISKIRGWLERTKFGRGIIKSLRKTRIVNGLHCAQDLLKKRKNYHEINYFTQFFLQHKIEFSAIREMLADERSKEVWDNIIKYKQTRSRRYLKSIVDDNQYFDKTIVQCDEEEVFVDCGAYIGDTFLEFTKNFEFKKAFLFEPDKSIKKILEKNVIAYKDKVQIINAGAYSANGKISFFETGIGTGKVTNDGLNEIDVKKIDDVVDLPVTFIKMDIEGSELEALKGAESIIRTDKPKLAICIYHKNEDFFEIPNYIVSLVPDYRLYVRHYSDTSSETVLYCVI